MTITLGKPHALAMLAVLFMSLFVFSTAGDAAGGGACVFDAGSSRTDARTKHMNGYNVCVSNAAMETIMAKEPYPYDKITDSLDRREHIEQLLRFQDPNKLGYMYILGPQGNVVTWYTIAGKPSSTQSSLTPDSQSACGDCSDTTIASPADDGSFGPNEGGDAGVMFFTTSGCLIEHAPTWIYSDCPLNIGASPIVIATLDANAKPTSAFDQEFGG